jgi:hypothetical protein
MEVRKPSGRGGESRVAIVDHPLTCQLADVADPVAIQIERAQLIESDQRLDLLEAVVLEA